MNFLSHRSLEKHNDSRLCYLFALLHLLSSDSFSYYLLSSSLLFSSLLFSSFLFSSLICPTVGSLTSIKTSVDASQYNPNIHQRMRKIMSNQKLWVFWCPFKTRDTVRDLFATLGCFQACGSQVHWIFFGRARQLQTVQATIVQIVRCAATLVNIEDLKLPETT